MYCPRRSTIVDLTKKRDAWRLARVTDSAAPAGPPPSDFRLQLH